MPSLISVFPIPLFSETKSVTKRRNRKYKYLEIGNKEIEIENGQKSDSTSILHASSLIINSSHGAS